jgi:hypothetical protein
MSNNDLMEDLKRWARDDSGISPDVSNCGFYGSCNVGGILNGKHCLMSYVGRDYGRPGVFPRLVLVGIDHRDQISGDFMHRRSGIEHAWQNGGEKAFNPHYGGVARTAAAVFGGEAEFCQTMCRDICKKSRVPFDLVRPRPFCVLDRIAQPNAVKCVSELATNANCKATKTMWDKCAHHLVAELKILRPEVVVFHGAPIKTPVTKAIKELEPIKVAGIGPDPVLYRWPAVGAHLLYLHHPARGHLDRQWDTVVVPALNYLRAENLIPD